MWNGEFSVILVIKKNWTKLERVIQGTERSFMQNCYLLIRHVFFIVLILTCKIMKNHVFYYNFCLNLILSTEGSKKIFENE